MKIKNKISRINKIFVIMVWFLIAGAILALGGFVEVQNGKLNVTGNLLVDADVLYVDSTNNKVGIGTTNPGKELEVGGRINGTELNISGNANLAYGSGKVGIGTTNPTMPLHVIGNANVSGNISVGGNSALRVKTGSFTRDTTTASGTQAVTGVGFKPSGVIFFATQDSAVGEMSTGMDDGATRRAVMDYFTVGGDDRWAKSGSYSITSYETGSKAYHGIVNSFDSDGFTISWTRSGTPSGTLTVIYLAFG